MQKIEAIDYINSINIASLKNTESIAMADGTIKNFDLLPKIECLKLAEHIKIIQAKKKTIEQMCVEIKKPHQDYVKKVINSEKEVVNYLDTIINQLKNEVNQRDTFERAVVNEDNKRLEIARKKEESDRIEAEKKKALEAIENEKKFLEMENSSNVEVDEKIEEFKDEIRPIYVNNVQNIKEDVAKEFAPSEHKNITPKRLYVNARLDLSDVNQEDLWFLFSANLINIELNKTNFNKFEGVQNKDWHEFDNQNLVKIPGIIYSREMK